MRVLLLTFGSRGDVQPLVALAVTLREFGQEVHLCVPPDFREWIESLGLPVTPIGPGLRSTAARPSAAPPTPEPQPQPEQRDQMIESIAAMQFEAISSAAARCDVIVIGGTVLQLAAPTVAETMGIPYVFAAYCPMVLPSPRHPPPMRHGPDDSSASPMTDYTPLWLQDARWWNDMFRAPLNSLRASLGLASVEDVRHHVLTEQPWLAADQMLGPWPDPGDPAVFQTGAWILRDERPLPAELEAFLDAGEPPVYFGFGSIRAPENLSQVMIESARVLGRRAIVSRGWADLALVDAEPDCLCIDEVNQQALFTRVAAVVHHGGAGTTTAAARAGAAQLIIPQYYDQHYWAERIAHLGVGAAHAPSNPTTSSLTSALELALQSDVAGRAHAVALKLRSDGAEIAARQLIALS